MKKLIIIPARAGSKSIKNKNFIDINGKPLISYTIQEALLAKDANLVDEVIVSTDSKKIKKIAETYGAKVPFLRPPKLSEDNSKSVDLVLHALDFYSNKRIFFDEIILLQPTSPLRVAEDIKQAITIFDNNESNSLISCYEEDYINDLVMYKSANQYAIPLNKNHNLGTRRQEEKNVFVRNGAIYISKTNYIREAKKIISDEPLMYIMPKERSINIDTLFDLEIARCLITQ